MSDNLQRRRGDTKPEELTVIDTADGSAQPITGCSFVMTIDPARYPADATNNIAVINGVIVDAAAGVVEFPFSADDADHVGKYWYDVEMTDAFGFSVTIKNGRINFKQDIGK